MLISHDEALELVRRSRLVAILRRVPEDKLENTVSALLHGGVRVLEFTFDHDSPDYIEANARKIRRTAELFGDSLLLGCGTAVNTAEVDAAYDAGARLVISPNVSAAVIRRSKEKGMVSMPGAFTPTEIVSAWEAGADIVKLFPASELGPGYIKAIRGPLGYIPMTAVGGVKPENVSQFLDCGVCGFGVGGPLVMPEALKNNDYAMIEARAKAFTDAIAAWEAAHE